MEQMIWVGGPDDVRHGEAAKSALAQCNDSRYWTAESGVVRVDRERWQAAQRYEARGWLECWRGVAGDRNDEHLAGFNGYANLKHNLGSVLEMGCGPFTQLQTILRDRIATHITLLDPLLKQYRSLAHCPYKNGTFYGYPADLRAVMGEELLDTETFDTIICINVLEHVMDAEVVLNNIHRALKSGGTLVFGERHYDQRNQLLVYDVGHPILVHKIVLDRFKSRFTPIYDNDIYFIGTKP